MLICLSASQESRSFVLELVLFDVQPCCCFFSSTLSSSSAIMKDATSPFVWMYTSIISITSATLPLRGLIQLSLLIRNAHSLWAYGSPDCGQGPSFPGGWQSLCPWSPATPGSTP